MTTVRTKQATLLLIYGEGGHRREMSLLLEQLAQSHKSSHSSALSLVSMGTDRLELPANCQLVQHFSIQDIRDKHSRFRSLLSFIPVNWRLIKLAWTSYRRHRITGVISTGPGVAILPMLLLRLLRVNTVFIETYCRFETRSMTGRIMSKIAHRFLVQNKSQLALYSKAEYCGRL